MKLNKIELLKYQRQHLINHVSEAGYEDMFKIMSPVPTLFWIEPGTPPEIQYRCDFEDGYSNDISRRMRQILKGRFQGGNVGYVLKEDMPLYAKAYKKEIKSYTEHDQIILDILTKEGPMNNSLLKEISGLLSKEVSKSLSKLQKAFIVFEDQVDKDNDRAWYFLEDEFPELDFNKFSREEALMEIVQRFAYMNVMFDEIMVKSYTRWSNKDVKLAVQGLLKSGELVEVDNENSTSPTKQYMLVTDFESLKLDKSNEVNNEPYIEANTQFSETDKEIYDKVFILDLNDYLVKSHDLKLKENFEKSEYKTLRYIYTRGEFIGRVLGYFRYGPDDVEDVDILDQAEMNPEIEKKIIEAINENYQVEGAILKRFCGKSIL